MNESGNREPSSTAHTAIYRLRLVSRIALLTSAAAVLILSTVVFLLSDESGVTYAEVFRVRWLTQTHLDQALLIAGLILLGFVALITWLISLYSSFRVAGPLYRFAQNMSVTSEGISPIGIRHDDCLQNISQQLLDTIQKNTQHRQQLADACEQLRADLHAEDVTSYASRVTQLKEIVDRVRLNG